MIAMPVYPCRKCGTPVDPTCDFACRGCKEKQPYDCSRCNKVIGPETIFQLDRLKTKKPLLCLDCGQSGEVIKCGVCKLSLVRSSGIVGEDSGKVYHTACHEKQLKLVGQLKKMLPVMALSGIAVGIAVGESQASHAYAAVLAIAFAAAFSGVLQIITKWQTPS
jgi:hypothetical protein